MFPTSTRRWPVRPSDRRADRAVIDVDLRRTDGGIHLEHGGFRHVESGLLLILLGLRHRPRVGQALDARELRLREVARGLRLREVRLGRVELRLVDARVDRVEEVALLDVGAVLEVDLGDAPRDLGLDRNGLARDALADLVEIERDRGLRRERDLHGRRGALRHLRRGLGAGREETGERREETGARRKEREEIGMSAVHDGVGAPRGRGRSVEKRAR
jgi:hypothetical protein